MNSKERKQARFERRQADRKVRIEKRNKKFEEIFTFSNLYEGYLKSKKGVMWKPSTQTFKANAMLNVRRAAKELHNGTWKSKGFVHFTIIDRGKQRNISSVHISERVVQRTLCDELLSPCFTPSLIYDNSGSVKGKGMKFALDRCKQHIRKSLIKNNLDDIYVLTYDFSKYFDSINHKVVMNLVAKYVMDKRCLNIVNYLISEFGDNGLGLGSQVSQNIAILLPNRIDHYVKDELGVKFYGRYMDDAYLIHDNKEQLKEYLEDIKKIAQKLNIKLNEKKTQIKPLKKGFTFLKMRFFVVGEKKIILKPSKKTITRQRRKIKRMFNLLRKGLLTIEQIKRTIVSMYGHLMHGNAFYAKCNLKKLFNEEVLKCI